MATRRIRSIVIQAGSTGQVGRIDHTIPFNHANPKAGGLTVPWNLKCMCRQHHLLKTFWGWRDQQLPDGTEILATYPP